MRALAIGAFVLDGAAAVGFVAMMALGEGRMTPLDGFILGALLLGFLSALGSVVAMDQRSTDETAALMLTGAAMFDRLPDAAKRDLRRHFPDTVPASGPEADPSQHLAILMRPSLNASASERVL
jgi:hypothetical protein